MKIMMCGDIHKDVTNIEKVFEKAKEFECAIIIALGDVCYFPHTRSGKYFISLIENLSRETGILFYMVKGNHDNHEVLSKYSEITELHPGIFFIPNCVKFTFGNYSFCAVGGAVSIDILQRQRMIDFWDNERISQEDVRNSESMNVDVVLSHDCPISVDIDYYLGYKREPKTTSNRRMLQAAVDNLKPKFLFHGHYHSRIKGKGLHGGGEFLSLGLASNKTGINDQIFVFDTSLKESEQWIF